MSHRYREIAKAVALGESETASALYRQLNDEETAEYHTYLTVFSAVLIAVRLEEDSSRRAIDAFIDELKRGYASLGDALKPLALEATVRATMGEEELLHELDAGDQLQSQMLCVRAITATMPKVAENVDGYLAETETLLATELD